MDNDRKHAKKHRTVEIGWLIDTLDALGRIPGGPTSIWPDPVIEGMSLILSDSAGIDVGYIDLSNMRVVYNG